MSRRRRGVEQPVGQVAGERAADVDAVDGLPARLLEDHGARASSVCAQRPGPKARGCRSSEQPAASTSRALGPRSSSTVRLAERSTSRAGAVPAARASRRARRPDHEPLVRAEPQRGPARRRSAPGSAPAEAGAPAPPGRTGRRRRTPTCAGGVTSRTLNRHAAPPPGRTSRIGDRRGDHPVDQRGVDRLAVPLAPAASSARRTCAPAPR